MKKPRLFRTLAAGCLAAVLSTGFVGALAADDSTLPGLAYWNGIEGDAVTTESGLQYKVLVMGKGRKPSLRSTVDVHYRGLLENGVVFDTSYNNDEPVEFRLRNVIDGWSEGIQLMPEGSVFVFKIPPELAYGSRGSGAIPPDATLIFEVELYDTN